MPCNCRHLGNTHEHINRGDGSSPSTAAQHVSLNGFIDLGKATFFNVQQSRTDALCIIDPSVLNARQTNATNHSISNGVLSDADEEILIFLYFTDFLRIKGVNIVGPGDSQSPAQMKLFCNRGNDAAGGFDAVRRLTPDQTLSLANGSEVTRDLLYLVDPHKFNNVSNLAVLVDRNFGADETRILRLEFFGETSGQQVDKQLATTLVFEARANPADHPELVDETRNRAHVL